MEATTAVSAKISVGGRLIAVTAFPQGIVPPISQDSSLAIHPGSKREEAADVSEYGSTERGGIGAAATVV